MSSRPLADAPVALRSATPVSIFRYLDPVAFVRHLWRQRDLIWQFTRREIEGRYRTSALGILWAFINPLALLAVYTLVFGVIFRQRWPGRPDDGLAQFGLVLFAGLTVYNVFSECLLRAPGLIVGTPNYVKRVVFPLEVLPLSVIGAALFHATISVAVLLVAHVALGGQPRWQWLLLPAAFVPVSLLALGLLWALSSLGVFVRDLSYGVGLVTQALFFLTPIFYPVDLLPERFRFFVHLNPLSSVVTTVRGLIFPGLATAWSELAVATGVGLLVMVGGYAWFMRTRRAFGDVI